MASNLFDEEELKLFINDTFRKLTEKFEINIDQENFSQYFLTVMNYLDNRESKRIIRRNIELVRKYKKNLLELTAKCVFETILNHSLGAGNNVLLPIYEEYKTALIQKTNSY
jgi:ADP-dependent phosphofructokinase/glucokinase